MGLNVKSIIDWVKDLNNVHILQHIGKKILTEYINDINTKIKKKYKIEDKSSLDIFKFEIDIIDKTCGYDLSRKRVFDKRRELDKDKIGMSTISCPMSHSINELNFLEHIFFKSYMIKFTYKKSDQEYILLEDIYKKFDREKFSALYFDMINNLIPTFYDKLKSNLRILYGLSENKYDINFYKLYNPKCEDVVNLYFNIYVNNKYTNILNIIGEKIYQPYVALLNGMEFYYLNGDTVNEHREQINDQAITFFPLSNEIVTNTRYVNCYNIVYDISDVKKQFNCVKELLTQENEKYNITYSEVIPNGYICPSVIVGNLFNNLLISFTEKQNNKTAFILYNKFGYKPRFMKTSRSIPYIARVISNKINDDTELTMQRLQDERYDMRQELNDKYDNVSTAIMHYVENELVEEVTNKIRKTMCDDNAKYMNVLTAPHMILHSCDFKFDTKTNILDIKNCYMRITFLCANYYSNDKINTSRSLPIISSKVFHGNDVKHIKLDNIVKEMVYSVLTNKYSDWIFSSDNIINMIDKYIDLDDIPNDMFVYSRDKDELNIIMKGIYNAHKYTIPIMKEYMSNFNTVILNGESIKEAITEYNDVANKFNKLNSDISNIRKNQSCNIPLYGNDINLYDKLIELKYFGENDAFEMKAFKMY